MCYLVRSVEEDEGRVDESECVECSQRGILKFRVDGATRDFFHIYHPIIISTRLTLIHIRLFKVTRRSHAG